MTDSRKVGTTSIDGLIGWLNEQRRENASASLAELLKGQVVDRNAVLDLACIDLMHQHRNGHPVGAEAYVRDFPQLSRTSDVLDLIDAELCVATELRVPVNLLSYCQRFPDLATEIEELVQLDINADAPCFHWKSDTAGSRVDYSEVPQFDASSSTMNESDSRLSGFSVDLAVMSGEQRNETGASDADYPLPIPDWFLVDQCLARDNDCCLLRGRDDVRGVSLAMKIIRVPRLLKDRDVTDLLDVCEAASRVQNPCWIAPRMAAIQMGHLGVIRPWQFANPWQPASLRQVTEMSDVTDGIAIGVHSDESANAPLDKSIVAHRWRNLAAVAFAVESAHRVGATHGAIHAGNLAVDHQGNVCVFDATSSVYALKRWLDDSSTVIQSLDQRIQMDVDDVVKLVCDTARWTSSPESERLVQQVRRAVLGDEESPLACIGEILMHYTDHHHVRQSSCVEQQPRWRTRISRWLSRKD